MQDQITRELEQIIANRIGDVGRCEDDCACTYCCAQRALRLRTREIGAVNHRDYLTPEEWKDLIETEAKL